VLRTRRSSLRSLVVLACTFAALFSFDCEALADEVEQDTADGSADCRAFREKNDKELAAYEKTQPAVPYSYPRESTVLDAPWGNFVKDVGHGGELVLATIIPHVGAQFRGDSPAAIVSWPWSVLILGPDYACSRKKGTYVVHGHRAHRFLVEPAVVSSKFGVGFSVRPGYRFIWHPTSWVVGPGLGIGSTIDIAGNSEPFRYSVGPEAVAHFGNCCSSSYFTFAVRYDHYFKGNNREIIGASLGYTFF
jgi:hypothetical protein